MKYHYSKKATASTNQNNHVSVTTTIHPTQLPTTTPEPTQEPLPTSSPTKIPTATPTPTSSPTPLQHQHLSRLNPTWTSPQLNLQTHHRIPTIWKMVWERLKLMFLQAGW